MLQIFVDFGRVRPSIRSSGRSPKPLFPKSEFSLSDVFFEWFLVDFYFKIETQTATNPFPKIIRKTIEFRSSFLNNFGSIWGAWGSTNRPKINKHRNMSIPGASLGLLGSSAVFFGSPKCFFLIILEVFVDEILGTLTKLIEIISKSYAWKRIRNP